MTKYEEIGIGWWNNLLPHERVRVLARAVEHKEDASVADAYEMWRQRIISTEAEPPNNQAHRLPPTATVERKGNDEIKSKA